MTKFSSTRAPPLNTASSAACCGRRPGSATWNLLCVFLTSWLLLVGQIIAGNANDKRPSRSVGFMLDDASGFSYCPKVCDACFGELFFCQKGGLFQIPRNILPSAKKVLFSDHPFRNPVLRRHNLSVLASPKMQVERLWLRNCSLEFIEPHTFDDLSQLQLLDLSSNRITSIAPKAFFGLQLTSLNLNHNRGLLLGSASFDGLRVMALSLEGCGLRSLAMDVFIPIMGSLNALHLKANQLSQLDPAFEHVFHRVDLVDLSDNPLSCRCDMQWLHRVYLWKWRLALKKNSSITSVESTFPRCDEPRHLRGTKFHQLSKDAVFCEVPSVQRIEIHYQSPQEAILECHAQGSPLLAVKWMVDSKSPSTKVMPSTASAIQLLESNQSFTRVLLKQPEKKHDDVKNSPGENFQCLATDTEGSARARVTLTWPRIQSISTEKNRTKDMSDEVVTSAPHSRTTPLSELFLEPRFTMAQFLVAVGGTMVTTFILCTLVCLALWKRQKLSQRKRYKETFFGPATSTKLLTHPHLSQAPASFPHSCSAFLVAGNFPRDLQTSNGRSMSISNMGDRPQWPSNVGLNTTPNNSNTLDSGGYDLPNTYNTPTILASLKRRHRIPSEQKLALPHSHSGLVESTPSMNNASVPATPKPPQHSSLASLNNNLELQSNAGLPMSIIPTTSSALTTGQNMMNTSSLCNGAVVVGGAPSGYIDYRTQQIIPTKL